MNNKETKRLWLKGIQNIFNKEKVNEDIEYNIFMKNFSKVDKQNLLIYTFYLYKAISKIRNNNIQMKGGVLYDGRNTNGNRKR